MQLSKNASAGECRCLSAWLRGAEARCRSQEQKPGVEAGSRSQEQGSEEERVWRMKENAAAEEYG